MRIFFLKVSARFWREEEEKLSPVARVRGGVAARVY